MTHSQSGIDGPEAGSATPGRDARARGPADSAGSAAPEGAPREVLTDEEIARLRATQVRRLIVFGILGVLMLILGFFAGRQLRQQSGSQGVPGSSRIAAPTASCGVASSPTQVRAADPGAASEAAVGGADAGMRGAA